MTSNRATAYAAVYALLRASADVADHIVQTHRQAVHKADPGRAGHAALAGHVGSYAAVQAAALLLGNRLLGLGLSRRSMAAAIALSAGTHYFIDRRWPIRRMAEALGKAEFYELGGPLGGNYLMDQSAHHLAEAVAAYVAVRKATR